MLAGLVVASFTMTPSRQRTSTAATAAPAVPVVEDDVVRVSPIARSMTRVRDFEDTLFSDSARSPAEVPDPPAADAPAEPAATPEPTPAPTPPPTPRPVVRAVVPVTNVTTAAAEARMLELMNASRARGGLAPLALDIGVADTARAHSAAEAQVRYVYHDGPDGTAHSRDVPACGTGWYGENTGKVWNDNVDALHIEFMSEPWVPINHRTNIMDPAFRRVGVGAVIGPDAMYMTMVFCR